MEHKGIFYQASIINICLNKQISQENGAKNLGISPRQLRRKIKKYKDSEGNIFSLEHGLKGKPSNNSICPELKKQVIDIAKSEKYKGFSNVLFSSEMEKREKIAIKPATLRSWLISEKIIEALKRRTGKKHISRPRKLNFGEMLQIDGSFHEWFINNPIKEDRKGCLLNLIDDNTSINDILFDKQETMDCACRLLWNWIEKYGIPMSIYCDRRNMYVTENHYDTMLSPKGFFRQMCENLNIRVIAANSPQAKGRVERSNKTHQDRLIKLMKLDGIRTIQEANKYVKNIYIPEHNKKYAMEKTEHTRDIHRQKPENLTLDDVCYIEEKRVLKNDWTISYRGEIIQLLSKSKNLYSREVLVRRNLAGELKIIHRNVEITYKKIA